jgi:hypothetical protein
MRATTPLTVMKPGTSDLVTYEDGNRQKRAMQAPTRAETWGSGFITSWWMRAYMSGVSSAVMEGGRAAVDASGEEVMARA